MQNTQAYVTAKNGFFSKHLMPEKVDIEATTTLEIEKNSGKILSHIEVWHNKSVSTSLQCASSCCRKPSCAPFLGVSIRCN